MKMLVIDDGGDTGEFLLVAENDAEAMALNDYPAGKLGSVEVIAVNNTDGVAAFGKSHRPGIRINFYPEPDESASEEP